jgi:hypothetical protein
MESEIEIHSALLKFLNDFEKRHGINLIYVCETSSRPQQIHVEDSDYDLKGLFLPNPGDSLKIIPKIQTQYQIVHNKILVDDKEFDVDINFYDFKEFSRQKLNSENPMSHFDFSFFSPMVYVDKFPHLIKSIKENLFPKPSEFYSSFKGLTDYLLKSQERNKDFPYKKLLGALVAGVNFFHVCVFDQFPYYNVWDELKFLKSHLDFLVEQNKILQKEKEMLEEVFRLIEYYYLQKKNNGRKSSSLVISECQMKFSSWLYEKFKERLSVKKENNFTLEFFQNICDEIAFS